MLVDDKDATFARIVGGVCDTGKCCVFVIYQHKGKCNSLIIILLLFCLSRWVPLDPHMVDCLHIYNTFFVLTTDNDKTQPSYEDDEISIGYRSIPKNATKNH